MGKFRIDAEVRWSKGDQKGTQGNIPIESFVPGDGSMKVGSQQAKTVGELLSLFEMANGARQLTISVREGYANLYIRPSWTIEQITLGMWDVTRMVAQARCNDPKVPMAVVRNGIKVMTLDFHDNDDGFLASRT